MLGFPIILCFFLSFVSDCRDEGIKRFLTAEAIDEDAYFKKNEFESKVDQSTNSQIGLGHK